MSGVDLRYYRLYACAILLMLLLPLLLCFDVKGEEGVDTSLFLSAGENTECGEIAVTVCLSSEKGICGLFAEVGYDGEKLVFLGYDIPEEEEGRADAFEITNDDIAPPISKNTREGGEKDISVTCLDTGKSLRVLIDGAKNSEGECELARLYFGIRNEAYGRFDFSFYGIGADCVLSLDESGTLRETVSSFTPVSVLILPDDVSDVPALPVLQECRLINSGEESILRLSGTIDDNKCFAAGFELFIINLNGGGTEVLTLSGVIERKEGKRSILKDIIIEQKGALSIVVTPMVYRKDGYIAGEKRVILSAYKKQPHKRLFL